MFQRVYEAEPRDSVRRSNEFKDYVDLTSSYLQIRQRLDFLHDKNRDEEEHLRRVDEKKNFSRILDIQNDRSAAIEELRKELVDVAEKIENNAYHKRISKV